MAIYLGTNKVDGSIIVDPGSEVSYIPTVQSGTELGKLNIDGFNSSIYAPTIPTNISAFTNDAGYGAVVELTQAEYDALSTVEKNNGTIYYVTDAVGTYLTAGEVSCTDSDGNTSNVQNTLDSIGTDLSSVQDALDTEIGRTDDLIEQIRNIRSVSRGRVEGGTHTYTIDEFATYLIIMQTSSSEGYVAYILSRYSTYSHLHKLYNGSYVNDVTSYANGVLTITLTYPATVSIVKM